MAKAIAICKCATCGKEFKFEKVCNNRNEADSFEEWASEHITECYECKVAREKSELENKFSLPELTGSEKQVAWADKIRAGFIKSAKNDIESNDKCREYAEWLIANKTESRFWIDNRDALSIFRMKDAVNEFKECRKPEEEKRVETEAKEDMTVAPVERSKSGAAEIREKDGYIVASYEKDDDFRGIVKGLGYKWDAPFWKKQLSVTSGSAEDRIAELGNKLLSAGFAVTISNDAARQKAVSGEYEPEWERWIVKNGECFRIYWEKGNDEMYNRIKGISGAKYKDGSFEIPSKYWDEVEEFGKLYDFHFTAGALAIIAQKKAATVTVTPIKGRETEYHEQNVKDVLKSSKDILDDLKEEG